jgi:hypothetical protein
METETCEYVNRFECSNSECSHWEEQSADDPRNQMAAKLLELGESDGQYGLYECPYCNTLSWSTVIPKE